jgi:hypothetical protein
MPEQEKRSTSSAQYNPRSKSGEFLFGTPRSVGKTAQVSDQMFEVIARFFQFRDGLGVNIALDQDGRANPVRVQRLLDYRMK